MTPFQNNHKSIAPLTGSKDLLDFTHFIWDVDGTILNSEPIHARSVIETCAQYDIHIEETNLHQFLGKSHFDTYGKILEHTNYNRPFDEFLNDCIDRYTLHLDEIEMRQDVLDVLHMLDREGKSQSIFSNNPRSVVNPTAAMIEKRLGKKDFFQQVVSLDGTLTVPHEIERKPSPDGYLFTLDLLGVTADKVAVIEDSATGTTASATAKIFTIGWAHDSNENTLKKSGADLVICTNLMDAFDSKNGKINIGSTQFKNHNAARAL